MYPSTQSDIKKGDVRELLPLLESNSQEKLTQPAQ